MNAKDDLQYIIIMRCLDQMEREGIITSQEYARAKKAAQKENEKEPAASEEKNVDLVRTFHFSTLDDVISSAKALNQYFAGSNSLYKNTADANYQLVLHQSGCKPEEFNKVCNMLSEYGRQESFSLAAEAFLLEHGNAMVKENALQELASL